MKKIAIIGAGISGLYFANLLEKESRFEYKIYDPNNIKELVIKNNIVHEKISK